MVPKIWGRREEKNGLVAGIEAQIWLRVLSVSDQLEIWFREKRGREKRTIPMYNSRAAVIHTGYESHTMSSLVETLYVKYVLMMPQQQERKPKAKRRITGMASLERSCRDQTVRMGSSTTTKSVRVLIMPATRSDQV